MYCFVCIFESIWYNLPSTISKEYFKLNVVEYIAKSTSLPLQYVANVVELLDAGNTVPFIARYRKERTGAMDDQSIRKIAELLERLRNLEKRKLEIIRSLEDQGLLNKELAAQISCAENMTALEDIYRPFKQKRKTRASIAIERGLTPLADLIMLQKPFKGTLDDHAAKFLSSEKNVSSTEEALQGARDIIAEKMSNDAECRHLLRSTFIRQGIVRTKAVTEADSPYSMYYDHAENIARIADHRILAINRGEREGFLKVHFSTDDATAVNIIKKRFILPGSATAAQLEIAAEDAWSRLIAPSLEREIRSTLTERASASAVNVFGSNLHQLLMQPPVKGHVTLGVDPGFRTGCKLAVVDAQGKVLQTGVGYFTLPGMERQKQEARRLICDMIRKHHVTAIAIGNGTASRESEAFIAGLLGEFGGNVKYAIVSEAGASVYSASKLGAEEFPEYGVSLRSAISIARRLQDPLAELVKIDPKSIGVGQYQHDLKESELSKKLEGVVEDCVNAVGVELSTASAALLTHVAGIGPVLAKNIVAYREENGIESRAQLKKVPKLGPKAFEQSAGFLRIASSKNALDATAVHPESYPAAKALVERLGYTLSDLRGGAPSELKLRAEKIGMTALATELGIGEITLSDILNELIKPGRDPREDLPPTILRSDILDIDDLQPGMKLKGTVRNVIDFGVFVDIGVHQDGLVHVSRMSNRFIRHPSEAAKVGDIVDVWIIEVDKKKKRISLSMVSPK